MLQAYLDKMSELLLHENLSKSKRGDDVSKIAHARTVTVLPKLDPNRKSSIVLFLAESGLIDCATWIIDMSYTDLSGVDLSWTKSLDSISLESANLQGANLSEAVMTQCNFEGTNLRHANFEGANLWKANLTEADLTGARLTGADLMSANLTGITGITLEELKKQAKSLKGAIMPDGSKHS